MLSFNQLHSAYLYLQFQQLLSETAMVMRIKRTLDIAMSNYTEISGFCVFSYEGKVAYSSDNMNITGEIQTIIQAWNGHLQSFSLKNIAFLRALATEQGFVAINPDGAVSFICGTGKGVWFVSVFTGMDVDKEGILRECIQAAKNLETSVSIFDI